MLSFFRKIRKSLIDQSSARRYLVYAIGEIALVVIGILIALQINNWNEARKLNLFPIPGLSILLIGILFGCQHPATDQNTEGKLLKRINLSNLGE